MANLLTGFGFTKIKGPETTKPSRYKRTESDGHTTLWPCGVMFHATEHTSLLIRNHRPAAAPDDSPAQLFDPMELFDIASRCDPCTRAGLIHASRWFAHYEAQVAEHVGVLHRVPRETASRGPELSAAKHCSLERAWTDVAQTLATMPDAKFSVHVAQ